MVYNTKCTKRTFYMTEDTRNLSLKKRPTISVALISCLYDVFSLSKTLDKLTALTAIT